MTPMHDNCLEYLLDTNNIPPSPCFVLDMPHLRRNARILADVRKESGARILLALKAFASWVTFPELSLAKSGCLDGTCASSVDEALLGKEEFGGEVHAFAAAWSLEEIRELLRIADHISFNSLSQWQSFKPLLEEANRTFRKNKPVLAGLRINPEHSEGAPAIYNPCSPGSRLGIRKAELLRADEKLLRGITGLHFHTLCEQNADALARTLEVFRTNFKQYFKLISWFNFGGGHHITRDDYDRVLLVRLIDDWRKSWPGTIYLEPGEAVALNAGWLLATVLDVVEADMPIAILDTSAACHMPDVLEMPYKPEMWYKSSRNDHILKADAPGSALKLRLAGKSCLAGDVIGEYMVSELPRAGDRMVFGDMAIYSIVKTNTFNGLRLPAIALYDPSAMLPFKVVRRFGYHDFKYRLS